MRASLGGANAGFAPAQRVHRHDSVFRLYTQLAFGAPSLAQGERPDEPMKGGVLRQKKPEPAEGM
jgi:hypothetical protein